MSEGTRFVLSLLLTWAAASLVFTLAVGLLLRWLADLP